MRKLSPAEIGVLVFHLAYLAIGLTTSLQQGNAEFVMYFVVLCLLIGVVASLHFSLVSRIGGFDLAQEALLAGDTGRFRSFRMT